MVCEESPSSVLFRPCNHMSACEQCASIMKKCVECRTPIDEAVPFSVCCGGKVANNSKSNANKDAAARTVAAAAATPAPTAASASTATAAASALPVPHATAASSGGKSSNAAAAANVAATGRDKKMMNNGNREKGNHDVQKLQEQLNDIKEQVHIHGARGVGM